MRCEASCALIALSQLRFLQLFLSTAPTSAAKWSPRCSPPSVPFPHAKHFVPVRLSPVPLAGFGALHGRGRWLQVKDCSWRSPGGFAHWVVERDVALGSCPSASESRNMQEMKEKWLVVKDNWCSSEYGRLPFYAPRFS